MVAKAISEEFVDLPESLAPRKPQTYLLAVCDILGFSQLVGSNRLVDVVEHALGWFRMALHHSIHKNGFPEGVPATSELDRHAHVGVAWFSDTVLLYTKQDTDESARELLATLGWLLFETMIQGNTRIRAGVAYGDALIDPENSIYVGKPIIEANQLEKAQQWAGAALTESAVLRVPASARTGRFADWWLVPYAIPMKDRSSFKTLAIDWNLGIHAHGWRMLWSKESAIPSPHDWKENAGLCAKFMNTKAFHETNCHECSVAPGAQEND